MKTIDDALELRGRIFGAFEMAENEEDPDARRAWLTFVVVGGGPTGRRGRRTDRGAGTFGSAKATSVASTPRRRRSSSSTGATEILAMFGDRLSKKAAEELRRLGREHPDRDPS